MPGLDGYDLAEAIRALPGKKDALIMMLTSLADAGQRSRCHQLGITAVLTKPVMRPELLHAIVGVLRGDPAVKERVKPLASEPMLRPLQILLAEDNRVNQMVAVAILSKRGHIVRVALNGQEALEAFERERFDLVLMDVQMPVMGGYETTAAIRAVEQTAGGHIPIIALTAHAMKGDRELCLAAGMDGYLNKPIKPLALIQEVERLTAVNEPAAIGERGTEDAGLLDHFMGDAELLLRCCRGLPGIRVGHALAARRSAVVQRRHGGLAYGSHTQGVGWELRRRKGRGPGPRAGAHGSGNRPDRRRTSL